MKKLREILFRLRALFRRERLDAEMREEMQHHLDLAAMERAEDGTARDEARHSARRKFGGVEQIKEQARDQRGFVWLEQLAQDLRIAARALRKNPGFSLVAVLTLAIGIGATTALFTAVDAILLRPLPVHTPDRLVYLASGRNEHFSFPFYERMQAAAQSFKGFAAVEYRAALHEMAIEGGGSESVRTQSVTGNFFEVLRVSALHGRALTADDDRRGAAEPVAVISHAFWQRRFAGERAALGRSVQIEGVPVTIVGVMPPGFTGFEVASQPDLWLPLQLVAQTEARSPYQRLAEGVEWLVLFGRLEDGVTGKQAQTELRGIFRRQLEAEVATKPDRPSAERERILGRTLEVHPGEAGYVGARSQFKQPLLVLMGAVSAVLLIACTNIAGLLLARGAGRQRELAVRAALGAGRARIVRQLMTESVLLALVGGVGGLVVAQAGTQFLAAFLAQSGSTMPLSPDTRVAAFALVVSLLTGLLFGLMPALRLSRLDLVDAIKSQGNAVVSTKSRLQRGLVVAQVGLCVLLLAGAGLFFRTLHNLRTLDFGFVPDNLVTLSINPGRWRPGAAEQQSLLHRITAELGTLPGVRSATLSGFGMLTGNGYNTDYSIEGYTPAPDEEMRAAVIFAGPHFFETLRVPLLRGRGFTLEDQPVPGPDGAARPASVVILGEAFARKYFGDADPIGRHITRGIRNGMRLEIIGVARDTKYSRNLRDATPLEFYVPYFGSGMRTPPTFYVRGELSAAALARDIRQLLTRIEPRLTIENLRTMDESIDRLLVRERIVTQLVGFFGACALLLAALGLYGILAYTVAQRTREIGVRMALGATVNHVVQLVMRQGLGLVLAGCAVGMLAALTLTRFVGSLLYGVAPTDPLTFAAVIALLVLVALLACWLPARRAARVEPTVALRAE